MSVDSADVGTVVGAETSLRDAISGALKRAIKVLWKHRSFAPVRSFYSGLGSCLLYHRISPSSASLHDFSPYSGLSVSADVFDAQMRLLKDRFVCLSLPEATDLLQRGKLPPNSAVVTFDDGYKDNLSLALPILEKHGIPATVYVTTGLVDRACPLWWYEQEFLVRSVSRLELTVDARRYNWPLRSAEEKFAALVGLNTIFRRLPTFRQWELMEDIRRTTGMPYTYDDEMLTWDEVRMLDKHPLITIGAHTVTHPMLSAITSVDALSEVRQSKERLELELDHPVEHFAYPFGARFEIEAPEFEVARQCGFTSAVTTRNAHLHPQHSRHLHVLPRISINDLDRGEMFEWKLGGMFAMLQQQGRRLAVG